MRIHNSELETVAVRPAQYPQPDVPEIAFAGRSNVGKSSLLNLITGRKSLARVAKPGRLISTCAEESVMTQRLPWTFASWICRVMVLPKSADLKARNGER